MVKVILDILEDHPRAELVRWLVIFPGLAVATMWGLAMASFAL